jgi:hypothetical protein
MVSSSYASTKRVGDENRPLWITFDTFADSVAGAGLLDGGVAEVVDAVCSRGSVGAESLMRRVDSSRC